MRKYKPEGEHKPLDYVNTGQTEKGFFVAEVTANRLRVGFQTKKDLKATESIEWEWKWKYMLDKPLTAGK